MPAIILDEVMDDPLRQPPSRRYQHAMNGPVFMDCLERLKFTGLPSLRVFRSDLEDNEHAIIRSVAETLAQEDSIVGVTDRATSCDFKNDPKSNSDIKVLSLMPEVYKPTLDCGLKVIIGGGDGQRDCLTLGSGDFCQFLEECKFPREFAQSILTNNGSFARFTEHETVNGKLVPSALSMIIQTPYSPLMNFSFVIRASTSHRSATCLLFQKERHQTKDLLKRLNANREALHQNPLLIVSLLFQEHGYYSENYRHLLDRTVVDMERQTGHTSIAVSLFQPTPDYERLTRDLNACKTSLIFFDSITKFEKNFGTFCKEALEYYENLISRNSQLLDDKDKSSQLALSVADRMAEIQQLDYYLNLSDMRRIQGLSLERRVQTQINVLYSLISQRDSKINILVAEDSKKIAMAAKQDSTAMKTISVVTMVFLPGTFVASIFSSGIFNFQTTENGTSIAVSKYWWVYFVVTIALTLITLAVWVAFTKRITSEGNWELKGAEKEKMMSKKDVHARTL